jgi:hypothetical protein
MLIGDYRCFQEVAQGEGRCGHQAMRLGGQASAAMSAGRALEQIQDFSEDLFMLVFKT